MNATSREREAQADRARDLLEKEGKRPTRGQLKAILAEEYGHQMHADPDDEQVETSDNEAVGFPSPDDEDSDNEVDDPQLGVVNSEGSEADDAASYVEDSSEEVDDEDVAGEEMGPSTRTFDDFTQFCSDNNFFAPLTDAEESGIRLMDTLRKKKAPMNAYAAVFDWHLREKGTITEGMTLKDAGSAHYVGREALINRLAHRYNMDKKKPVEKVVRLPSSKEVVKIPVFDAEDCIAGLLTNPKLRDEDFDFFDDDPLAPPPELDYIGNNNTGSAYQSTYQRMINGPNQQLVGVIFYIDGATTGHFADLPVTAVKMSLSIFTREARLREDMWAILGYLPEVKVADGRGKKIFQESRHLEAEDVELLAGEGDNIDQDGNLSDISNEGYTASEVKAQDFHHMLSVILDSFVDPIIDRGMIWTLRYKNQLYEKIHLKFFISMVRSDTEEADALCGKYKSRTRNISHICRQCHVPTMECDDHRASYPPKTQKAIARLVKKRELDKLRKISQHYLKNAWYKCRFNLANDRGIHGACPSELLHQMFLGIFKYCRDIFFEFVGKDAQIAKEINGLAKTLGKLLSHQSERSLPHTNFSKGIKDGILMAKDYRGVLLIMAAVLVSTEGRKMLSTKRKFKKDVRKDDWILLVELLLEWEAYLSQPTMKKAHVSKLGMKHRYIMYIMKRVAKRTKGMGLNLMKFHAIIHLMEDIKVNGVPLEFDTSANESHHKPVKYAAQLTQRNQETFIYQVAVRMWEFQILDIALEEIYNCCRPSDYYRVDSDISMSEGSKSDQSLHDSGEEVNVTTTDGAMMEVFFDEETEENSFKMLTKSKHGLNTRMNVDLLDFLCDLQAVVLEHLPTKSLPIYTRHQRNGVIFNAHPNYRGQGPWKDWAVIDWGPGYGQLPCHCHAFVELKSMPTGPDSLDFGGIRLKDGVYAVVEEARVEETELGRSDLFVPHLKTVKGFDENGVTGRVFYLADVDAIVSPCAMIPDIGGPLNRYFMVKKRDDWVKDFITWINTPHHLDDMGGDSDEE